MKTELPREWTDQVWKQKYALEVVPEVLFDTELFQSETTSRLSFFQKLGGNYWRTKTNLCMEGQLPNPCAFLIQAVRVHGITSELQYGMFELIIGNKYYQRTTAWLYAVSPRFKLDPPVMIAPLQHFRASIEWDYAAKLGKGLNGQPKRMQPIQVCLIGQMARSVC